MIPTLEPRYQRLERPGETYYSAEEAQSAQFMQRVLGAFGSSLLVAGAGAFMAWSLAPQYFGILTIAYIVLAIAVMFGSRSGLAPILLYAFAACSGAITVPLMRYAIHATGGTAIIYNSLTVTGIVFCAMAWYGFATKRSLAGWRTFLMIGLIGALIAGIVGIFITHSTVFELLWSGALVVVFTGLTAYDINQIKSRWREFSVTQAALQIYLDFLNLFVALLRIMSILGGGGSSRD